MIWLAALVASAVAPPAPSSGPVGARVEARATVRILSGARLSFDGRGNPDLPPLSDGVIHDRDGIVQAAKLVEFQ